MVDLLYSSNAESLFKRATVSDSRVTTDTDQPPPDSTILFPVQVPLSLPSTHTHTHTQTNICSHPTHPSPTHCVIPD